MQDAVITDWDSSSNSGRAISSNGALFALRYDDGQAFAIDSEQATPQLAGRHEQPRGGRLKVPDVGDPVLIASGSSEGGRRWGYLRRYLDLTERRYGTKFREANQPVTA